MIDRLFDYPALCISVVFGVCFAFAAAFLIAALKPFVRKRAEGESSINGLVEITLNGFSALYGILLGLLAVGAYENLNNMGDVVSKEASAISVLYRDFRGYPEPVRLKLEQGLRAYALHVVEKSFVQQANRQRPTGESDLIDAVFDTLISFEPGAKPRKSCMLKRLRNSTR